MTDELDREITAKLPIITFTKISLPWGWLGNMSRHPIELHGSWRTAEHLFQALRFHEESEIRTMIYGQKSPMGAKLVAKRYLSEMVVEPRSRADLDLMRKVIRLKWAQHQVVRSGLRQTLGREIVEDVSARPNESGLFWGVANPHGSAGLRQGANWLGRLWMELRTEVTRDPK
jgi:ribA/ribD-fused uncharacterized protein